MYNATPNEQSKTAKLISYRTYIREMGENRQFPTEVTWCIFNFLRGGENGKNGSLPMGKQYGQVNRNRISVRV